MFEFKVILNLLHISYNDETYHTYTLTKEGPKKNFKDLFDKNGYNFHDVSKIGYSRPS